MVEDRVTDGKRIAQLLASELTGLSTGPLDAVAVVDADPDVELSEDGTFAYGVEADGERVGAAYVHPSHVRLELRRPVRAVRSSLDDSPGSASLAVTEGAEGARVLIESGAAVKRTADLVAATVSED